MPRPAESRKLQNCCESHPAPTNAPSAGDLQRPQIQLQGWREYRVKSGTCSCRSLHPSKALQKVHETNFNILPRLITKD
jgi:hypothetical protein